MKLHTQRSRTWRATRVVGALLVAVLVAATTGSIIQTQLNLAELTQLGAAVSAGVRVQTTLDDLLGFAPTWAAIVAVGFAIAFAAVALLSRWWAAQRQWLFVVAGALAIVVALYVMKAALGLTGVAAARSFTGIVLLGASGALGGWVFWRCRVASLR